METATNQLNIKYENLADDLDKLTKKVTDISGNLYDLSGNFYNLKNTVNAMKTKTDYITITDNDFYIKNSNTKINLECNDF